MAVEIVGSLEREERRHAHHHRPQRFVTDVEVIMGEAAPPASQNAVIGIVGGKPGNGRAERLALFHAFQNEVNTKQWYTNISRLPNSFVNVSIGRPPSFSSDN